MTARAFQDLLVREPDGSMALRQSTFSGEKFTDFRVPIPGTSSLIEEVVVKNCTISPGTCQIGGGTIVRNSTFDNLSCGDAIHIDAEAFLDRVTISGKKPGRLWIYEPSDGARIPDYSSVEWSLDIRGFQGEVNISGPPADKVLRDPDRHVVYDNAKLADIDWEKLNIARSSYWKLLARKSRGTGEINNIFSTLLPNDNEYEESMKQLAILRRAGFLS